MAVTVTDTRTVINEADDITGWNQGETVTTFFAESTACIAVGNNAPEQIYYTAGTAVDATSTLIYVYGFNNGLQNNWDDPSNPPLGLLIGDGTNLVSFNMAGGNKRIFSHAFGPTAWQQMVLDTDMASSLDTAGLTTERSGSFASLNFAALVDFGGDYESLSKALAGGHNMATDIIRVGNNGLVITGGLTGDRGSFLQIVVEDRSTAHLKAHGIIREYTTGIYGLQGPLTFGDAASTSWFEDNGVTIAFENRDIANDKYYLAIAGGTGETHFFLRNSTITTAGPHVFIHFNGASVDELVLSGNTFTGLSNTVLFANDASAGTHEITGNTFQGCGQIDPGTTLFSDNTISDSTDSDTGAVLLDADGSANWANLKFVSGGTGHAIYITATGTYEFSGFTYSGYGADGTTDAVVYNNSGGAVTINVAGGDAVTVRNGTGASTTVNNTVTVTLTGMKDNTEVRVYEAGTTTEIAGIEDAMDGTAGDRSWSFSAGGGTVVDIRVFNIDWISTDILGYTIPSADAAIPVTQVTDRVYANPA